jgi:hypothetical protein
MKLSFLFTFALITLLSVTKLFSQSEIQYAVSPDSIIRQEMKNIVGFPLDKPWKYHPGDAAEFALPGYNDNKWEERSSLRQFNPNDPV